MVISAYNINLYYNRWNKTLTLLFTCMIVSNCKIVFTLSIPIKLRTKLLIKQEKQVFIQYFSDFMIGYDRTGLRRCGAQLFSVKTCSVLLFFTWTGNSSYSNAGSIWPNWRKAGTGVCLLDVIDSLDHIGILGVVFGECHEHDPCKLINDPWRFRKRVVATKLLQKIISRRYPTLHASPVADKSCPFSLSFLYY